MKGQYLGMLVLAACLSLTGCSAMGEKDFSCKAPTKGVGCLPSMDVYEITNDPELYQAVADALEEAAQSGEEFDHLEVVERVRREYEPTTSTTKAMVEPIRQPLPVLQPAHAIRIWIAPWVDQKGDLHMPGYVFTEITPRRWSFGEAEVSNSTVLAPVQVDRRSRETAREATN